MLRNFASSCRLLASWSQPGGSIYIMEIGKHSQLGYQDSKLPPHQKKKACKRYILPFSVNS